MSRLTKPQRNKMQFVECYNSESGQLGPAGFVGNVVMVGIPSLVIGTAAVKCAPKAAMAFCGWYVGNAAWSILNS